MSSRRPRSPEHPATSASVPDPAPPSAAATDPWLIGVVGLHVLLAVLVFEPTLFPGADAGHYMVLGEALREVRGFRDIHLPGAPLHAKFPPGYPLILAVAGWLGGLQVFKVVSLACTAGVVWLTARVGQPFLGNRGARIAAALIAMSPVLLDFSHRVLSEAAFTLLLLITLAVSGEDTRGKWAAVVMSAAAAFFVRTAGLAILLAVVVHPLLGRQRRRAAVAVIASAACVIGWSLYQRFAEPSQPGYLQQLVLLNPYDPGAGTVGLADVPLRAARNLWRYVSSELPGSLGLPTIPRAALPGTAVTGIALGGLALGGWLRTAIGRLTVAHLVTAFYLGLILVWPPVWTDRRFLLPILPLTLIWCGAGLAGLVQRVPRRMAAIGAVGATAALAAIMLVSSARVIPDRLGCIASFRAELPCDLPQYAEFYAMARWAERNTPEGAVIGNRSPATFFLYSRRQGDVYEYSRDADVVLGSLEAMGADYVVVDRLSATTRLYLVPAILERRDRFEFVHAVGGDQGTILLRILPAPRTASAPSAR